MKGHERTCEGSRKKVLQSRKASTAKNMKFSEEKNVAAKLCNIFPFSKVNLSDYQTLPLRSCQEYIKGKLRENKDHIKRAPRASTAPESISIKKYFMRSI